MVTLRQKILQDYKSLQESEESAYPSTLNSYVIASWFFLSHENPLRAWKGVKGFPDPCPYPPKEHELYHGLQDIIAILGMDELSEEDKLTVARARKAPCFRVVEDGRFL